MYVCNQALEDNKGLGMHRTQKEKKPENIVFGIGVVLILLYVVAMFSISVPKHSVQQVYVEDETPYVDDILVEKNISDMSAYKDMNVFVWVREGEHEDNLNEETLEYMRDNNPDLISGDKWADGWFILSLSIESGDSSQGSGQVGTYFGEDIKLSESTQLNIQEKGYSDYQSRDWAEGLIRTADEATNLMARPSYASPTVILASSAFPVVLLGVWVLSTKIARSTRRRALDKVRDEAEGVDSYVRNADTVLVGEYASRIQDTSYEVLRNYTDILEKRDKVAKIPWFLLAVRFFAIRALSEDVDDLVYRVGLVSDAMTIYERGEGWKGVWFKQTQDVRSSINGLLVGELARNPYTRSQGESARRFMEDIDRRLYEGKYDVDILFREVEQVQELVSNATQNYMDHQMSKESNSEKRNYIEKSVENERMSYRTRRDSGLFVYYSRYYYYTPHIYTRGYSSGVSSYASSQSSSSSSSSYGGSGGGFSGAGSSSRF